MSFRTLPKYQVVTNGDMSASITSSPTNARYLDNVTYQADFTGSPVGVFTVQVSGDYAQDMEGNVTNAGSWVDYPLTSTLSTGAGSPAYADLNQLGSFWVRLVYTRTSGTGTLQAYVSGKKI